VKRELESTDLRAHKMMKGKVEPSNNANSGKGSVNNGTRNHTNCINITYDNSIRDTTKGTKEGGTTNDISTGKTIGGIEAGS
jgi:hypothetical protein